jgi:hypothetical protein
MQRHIRRIHTTDYITVRSTLVWFSTSNADHE